MKKTAPLLLFLTLLLAGGCRAQESLGNNAATSAGGTAPSGPATAVSGATDTSHAPVQTATLTGLYEHGAAPQRSQMCVIERGGSARFGVVAWTSPGESCSGNGTAVRQSNVLRLTMEGDEACTIEARVEGTHVTFPAVLPRGCAYYCSRGGRFAGAGFVKTGGTEADAARAEDLVGDRLCGG